MYFITWTNKDGKIRPDHADMIRDYLKARPQKEFLIEIYEKKSKRTIPENKKLHAMIRDLAERVRQDRKERGEEDYAKISDEIMKGIIREKFLTTVETINGKEFRYQRSTADLNIEECADLITNIYNFASTLGIELQ